VNFRRAVLHTLVGAYALDSLGEDDRARFERHLARCDACAQEVRGLRETTALLGSAAAASPPGPMRARVIAAAARIRQQPPAWAAGEDAGHGRPAWHRGPARLAWLARMARLIRPGGDTARRRRPLLRAALGLAVASAAAAVTLGVVAVGTQHRLDRAEERNREVAAVLTSRDAVMRTAPVSTGGTATVVMSHAMHMIVFSAGGLRPLSVTSGYELWLIGPRGVRSAGMLPPVSNGSTDPMVAAGIAAGDKIGLTVEPAHGSPHPTTRPVLMLPLPD
jgi:anti-sigma-K factor RskA